MRKLLFVFGMIIAFEFAVADSPFVPPRVTGAPAIDGVLEEDMWSKALVVSDFFQRFPKEGATPSEHTEVRILYTSTAMYIALKAYDSFPDHLSATVLKRDDFEIVKNDQFAMAIDSYNDARNGYWFSARIV